MKYFVFCCGLFFSVSVLSSPAYEIGDEIIVCATNSKLFNGCTGMIDSINQSTVGEPHYILSFVRCPDGHEYMFVSAPESYICKKEK